MYTRKELQRYKVDELKVLAKYEGIVLPEKIRKGEIIEILTFMLNEVEPGVGEISTVEEVPCSVRVRRIRGSKEN